MTLVSHSTDDKLRSSSRLIIIVIAIILIAYISFEILEDIFIDGTPLTNSPLITAIVSFTKDVTNTISSWGYGGIFSLMLLESSSLPIPSEVILPFSGYLVSTGQLNFWATVLGATVAGLAGSLIDYYIGLKGIQVLAKRRVLGRVFFSQAQLQIAASWFKKYGSLMVFIARLIPGLRTIISFPAGAVRMPMAKFLAFTVVGCVIWNGLLIYVGYYLGKNWHEVAGVSQYIIVAVAVTLIVLVIAYFTRRHRQLSISKKATT